MLVLSRKQNEQILIGNDIKITVLKIRGNTVRLGIEAPRHVHVVRGELPARREIREVTVEFKTDPYEPDPAGSKLRVIPKDADRSQPQSDSATPHPIDASLLDESPASELSLEENKTNRLRQIIDQITSP